MSNPTKPSAAQSSKIHPSWNGTRTQTARAWRSSSTSRRSTASWAARSSRCAPDFSPPEAVLKPTTVLIAGAGPTGLALACDLRLHGVDAQVVDKFDQPPTTTRALGVQPRGRQILDRL